MKNLIFLLIMSFFMFSACEKAELAAYQKMTFENSEGKTLPYRILFPKNYNADEKYPLLLFLHGAGERGTDNEMQLVHGSDLFLNNIEKYPAIVVFPQCPKDVWWGDPKSEEPKEPIALVMELTEELLKTYSIDQNRLYVGGLSMGGYGTFDIIARMPNTFAAAFPICGGGSQDVAYQYVAKTALWIFHGAKDEVVKPEESRNMHKVLKAMSADVKYTEYPEAGHDSWTPAFAEPDLLDWIFSQRPE